MKSSLIIAKYTFIDYMKSRSLFAVVLMAFFIFLATFVAAQLTYKTTNKVIIDIGLGLTAFFIFLSSVYWGQKAIQEEIEKKTVHTILSKGTSRAEFFIGKFLSMSLIIGLNLIILSVFVIFLYWLFDGIFQKEIFFSVIGFYISALLLSSIAVFFSFFVNGYLAFISTLSIFVTSSVVATTLGTRFVQFNPEVENFLISLKYVLPDFNKLNFTDYIISFESVEMNSFFLVCLYGIGYLLVVNLCSYFLVFNKKELS